VLSALEPYHPDNGSAVVRWLSEAQSTDSLRVRRVPLHALADWAFEPETGNLRHRSGRFFSVEGIGVCSSFGSIREWSQPIINQSDVGILGLLIADGDGALQVLVQRKVEPGNMNVAQASPTVQATHSNYTRVHGGTAPPYLHYFLDPPAGAVLVDQLQMEQAARYCGKRNRNMIVRVQADEVPVGIDHRWVAVPELLSLAQCPNALNLDTRSVLSCLPVACFGPALPAPEDAPFPARVRGSLTAECDETCLTAIAQWRARLDAQFSMHVRALPLREVAGWQYDGDILAHESGRFFEVLGVSIQAPTREVPAWDQPLIRGRGPGVVGFLCQQRGRTLRFLVRGVLEPGDPHVRVGPTLQCVPDNHRATPLFFDEIVHAPDSHVRLRAVQSEEGGRFYHDERLLVVVELPPDVPLDVPPNFMWMTVREIKEMIGRHGCVNIEARSLIACLPVGA